MDFLTTLLTYMAATLVVAVESASTPTVTPVPTPAPTPEPVSAAVETVEGFPSVEATVTPTPTATATVSVTPAPVPTITPNTRAYRNLSMGDRGEEVRRLQEKLIELGYLPEDAADGAYGGQTRNAVRRFQYYNGLTVDGVAGRATQTNLFENPEAAPYPGQESPTPGAEETADDGGRTGLPGAEKTPTDPPEPTVTPVVVPTPEATEEPEKTGNAGGEKEHTEEETAKPEETAAEATEEPEDSPEIMEATAKPEKIAEETTKPEEAAKATAEPEAPDPPETAADATAKPEETAGTSQATGKPEHAEETTAKPEETAAETTAEPEMSKPETGAEATAEPGTTGETVESPAPTEVVEDVDLDAAEETPIPVPTAEPVKIPYEDLAGWIVLNDSGESMQWTDLEDGVPVVRPARMQIYQDDIRISLDDVSKCVESWTLTDEGDSLVLEAQGFTLALLNEDAGFVSTVDGIEMLTGPEDFEFAEGHFIRVDFLTRALDGSWEWDDEEQTLMLRIPEKDAARYTD